MLSVRGNPRTHHSARGHKFKHCIFILPGIGHDWCQNDSSKLQGDFGSERYDEDFFVQNLFCLESLKCTISKNRAFATDVYFNSCATLKLLESV